MTITTRMIASISVMTTSSTDSLMNSVESCGKLNRRKPCGNALGRAAGISALDQFCGGHRIRAGGEADRHAGAGMAVIRG